MTEREPIHLLMRFSDRLTGVADTIAAHTAIIGQHHYVWLGKMGKPLGRPHALRINRQCDAGTPTYVYLVERLAGKYKVYRGTVVKVSRRLPLGEMRFVPPYYKSHKILDFISLWVKLSSLKAIDSTQLNNLLIANTLMAVPYSLPRSMAGLFVIREGQGMRA